MMKKSMIALMTLLIVLTMPFAAWSYPMEDTLVTDVDPPSTGWWMKDEAPDSNPDQWLANSNEETESAWVAGILGPDRAVDWLGKIDETNASEFPGVPLGEKSSVGFNPGFSWDFVLVKYDGYWALYEDDASNDNRVTVGPFGNGISHMSFYHSTSTQVPEPVTLVLLGIGLLGVAGLGRKH